MWGSWLLLCICSILNAAAQKPGVPAPTPKPSSETVTAPGFPRMPALPGRHLQNSERSAKVDPNVNIKLCVSEGTLFINGWERDEVRIFVRSGRLPGFKVLEKDAVSGQPNWLLISNMAPEGSRPAPMSECLAGREIELDVPMNTSISLTGRVNSSVIDSIRNVSVKTVEGDISLRNISRGINAATYQGNLLVESSGGSIVLETTTGNVLAFGVTPGQIGDLFKAKTGSGTLSLQKVDHRQIEASSITGTINFNGNFLAGGLYNFKTSNGPIRMQIPQKTSATIKASYGFGAFSTEIPVKYIYENKSSAGNNFQAIIGTGDATINLVTNTGSISIKKQ